MGRSGWDANVRPAASPFAAVLFDMDGTLVDTEPIWHIAEVDAMAPHSVVWTKEDQEVALGGPMLRVAEYMSSRVAEGGAVAPGPARMMEELLTAFERHLDSARIEVHDGADALLREAMAATIPVALVSNSPRRLLDKVLAAHPDFRFDTTLAGDEVADAKPHPGPYLEAAQRLGVSISECLIVEDSPTGVAAARESGAYVVAVEHLGQLDPGPRGIAVRRLDGMRLADLAQRLRR